MVALLDSQDIPVELLELFKNQYIVAQFLRHLQKNSLITNIRYKNEDKKDINNLTSFSIHRSTQVNILANVIESLSVKERQRGLSTALSNIQSYILNQIDLENSAGLKNFIGHC